MVRDKLGRRFCNASCRDGIKCDREAGLVYPAFKVTGTDLAQHPRAMKQGNEVFLCHEDICDAMNECPYCREPVKAAKQPPGKQKAA